MHQKNVNISCRVRADPAVEDYKFHWDNMSEGNETLMVGDHSGHYKAEVLAGVSGQEHKEILKCTCHNKGIQYSTIITVSSDILLYHLSRY